MPLSEDNSPISARREDLADRAPNQVLTCALVESLYEHVARLNAHRLVRVDSRDELVRIRTDGDGLGQVEAPHRRHTLPHEGLIVVDSEVVRGARKVLRGARRFSSRRPGRPTSRNARRRAVQVLASSLSHGTDP